MSQAPRLDAGSHVRGWLRRLLIGDLAILSTLLLVRIPLLVFGAGSRTGPFSMIGNMTFLAMFTLALPSAWRRSVTRPATRTVPADRHRPSHRPDDLPRRAGQRLRPSGVRADTGHRRDRPLPRPASPCCQVVSGVSGVSDLRWRTAIQDRKARGLAGRVICSVARRPSFTPMGSRLATPSASRALTKEGPQWD